MDGIVGDCFSAAVPGRLATTEFAAIDFESAGLRPGGTDVPVQIGMAVMAGREFRSALSFRSYLACDLPVTWSARKVHGICDEDLKDAPRFESLWPRVRETLSGRWVVAHGAATERRFLRAFPLHGFGPWLDTLRLARAFDPTAPSHALGDLAGAYGLVEELESTVEGFRWHDALSDAVASLALLRYFLSKNGLWEAEPALLLAADATPYHRAKAQARSR